MPISVNHIIDALASLGGQAHLDEIVSRVREIAPRPIPSSIGPIIRARIQERCSEAESFRRGAPDLFESVYGVAARRGVWRLKSADPLSLTNPDAIHDGAEADLETEEGRATLRIHLRRERSQKLITSFKAGLERFVCSACDFDFEMTYGKIGSGYIEAHHIIPVASLQEGARTRLSDLVPLCANCHRMVHRNGLITVAALKATIDQKRASNL